jgi:hypothetical protein
VSRNPILDQLETYGDRVKIAPLDEVGLLAFAPELPGCAAACDWHLDLGAVRGVDDLRLGVQHRPRNTSHNLRHATPEAFYALILPGLTTRA